jgi:hypothetical protein
VVFSCLTPGAGAAKEQVLVDRATRAGLSTHHITWGASEVDYNRDGRMDLWVSRHFLGAALWRNTGHGRYVKVRTQAWHHLSPEGKSVDRHDCQWADVDRNGLPDAYCSAGRFTANFVKTGRDNELWLQGPTGRFRDVGTAWGVGDICARGRSVVFLDANGDRFPDLFVGTEVPRREPDPCNRHPERYPNENSKLFINAGGEGFRYDRPDFDYGAGVGSRCALRIDFDGDGWDDLLTCGSDVLPKRSGTGPALDMRLFRNKHGHGFADLSDRLPPVSVADATTGDIDGDDDPDLIFASKAGFFYSLNTDGHFGARTPIDAPLVGRRGRAVAVGDADLDGDLDVFGCIGRRFEVNANDRLYLNDALTFTPVVGPKALGTADEVIAVHPGDDDRAQFLVLNGFHGTSHPNVQLLNLTGAAATGH